MQTQTTRFDRICSRLWIILAVGGTILAVSLFTAGAATAATDAFGKPAWSNARLTTHMKLANAQISLHDRMLNRHASRIRAAREDAQSALWIANQTYEDSMRWTLALIDCIREPEGQEEACLDAAVSAEFLPAR